MRTVSDLVSVLERERPDPLSGVELRGLLHDVGHGLATLSYLAEGMREDPTLSGCLQQRLDLMNQELARLLELVDLKSREPVPEVFDARVLLERLRSVTASSTAVRVTLRAGPAVTLRTDRTLLWRMVSNLVDNAVRAAGPAGSVEIAVERDDRGETTIEVADDGPGFGNGPGGSASLGLGLVSGLAGMCGASLRIPAPQELPTRVRLVFPPGGRQPRN